MRAKISITRLVLSGMLGALLVWGANQTPERSTSSEPVVLRIGHVDTPDGYILISELPEVTATLRGRHRDLQRFLADNRAVVRLTDVRPDQVSYRLRADDLGIPDGLTVVSFHPEVIDLELDRRVQRDVPIHVFPRGALEPGYELVSIETTPGTVRVSGPERSLTALDRPAVVARNVDLTGLRASRTFVATLVSDLPRVTLLDQDPVNVRIEIQASEAEASVGADIDMEGAHASHIELVDRRVTLIVRGPEIAIERLRDERVYGLVRLTDEEASQPGLYAPEPHFPSLPRFVRVMETRPSQIRVRVRPRSDHDADGASNDAPPPSLEPTP